MTQEQVNSVLRSLGATIGGGVAAWFISKGWLEQSMSPVVVETVVGLLLSLGALVWGVLSNRKASLVAKVAALPEVKKVEVAATPAGVDLAAAAGSTPAAVVVVAPR